MGKFFYYIFTTVFAISLFGCVGREEVKTVFSTEKEINSIEIKESASMEIIEADFDLGEKSFITDLGNTVYYNVRGLVSVPKKEGKYPVVLIVHGRYNNSSNETRFDKGFKYLIDYLASCGYAAFTLDIQGAYNSNFGNEDDNQKVRNMFPSFIEAFKNANNGIIQGFNVDLTDTLDLDNIVLIGHSRGGETAIDMALENKNIKGVISVAPTLPDNLNRDYPDIPMSIIVPELDGDVDSLDGFSLFDAITLDDNRIKDVELVFLENGNHNWFNSMLIKNDTLNLEDKEKIRNQISREDQETFLMNFSKDFLENIFNKKDSGILYNYSTFEPSYMYGLEVKVQSWTKRQSLLLDYNDISEISYEGLELNALKEGKTYDIDETNGFILPLQDIDGFNHKDLVNIKWRNRLGKVEIPIDNINLKKYNSLILNLAVDPSDELNIKNQNQSFTVRLEDSKGNIADIVLGKDSQALDYVEGTFVYTKYLEDIKHFWSSYTVLSDIFIPLEKFQGVNLKNITKVTLLFNKTDSGSIMINNIKFY
ncbi:MAG: alpha/beta fold hydrolase [Clostridium perfringens]|nr:alpha/beta fold hydrolase [Clostridium perfringens]